ncbi:M14 family zinc carboxypeptidase, partial [Bifidobacterium pullorum]|uniref:M14 family zinc carboxypeptidase n=2 Tax=Bacillati TaxID=1783272 RepID=UPI00195F0725
MPIAVFTDTDLSSAASLEEAGELVSDNGKLTVWIQAQIHPNEPAAGEAALVMVSDLCGSYGDAVLDDINVVVVPRINPD